MALKRQGEKVTIGDFILLQERPDLYFKVEAGSEEEGWKGTLTRDYSKWIGNDELYVAHMNKAFGEGNWGHGHCINVQQRDMGPYRVEVEIPKEGEELLKYLGIKIVDGVPVTATPEEVE